ncbi:TPA: hypothetical protein MI548_00510 [Klebsiella pneumoniae]|nr:hypothetical protein [Klebsiella pneumoniae]
MINRNKLEHILEYAKQQRHIGQSCKVPPEDMVEIMERLLNAGNSPATSDNWKVEAEKLAEMHGMSFVLFRHGEAPQCADPTKVVISFTDKGLGHDTLPAAPREVK